MKKQVILNLVDGTVCGCPAYEVRYTEPCESCRHLLTKYKPVDEQQVRKEAEDMFPDHDCIWEN